MEKSKKIKQIFTSCVNSTSIDETILEYICGMLEDESIVQNREEVESMLTPYLVDAQCAKDEEDAKPVIEKILLKMSEEGFNTCVNEKTASKDSLKALAAPIKLSKQINEKYGETEEKAVGWMRPEERNSIVNVEKLEAVEAKREKRNLKKKKDEDVPPLKPKAVVKINPNDFGIHPQPGQPQRSKDIKLENFSLSYGKESLLENCDLTLAYGRRYGLVGRNGSGKSTLLRHFADREIDGIPAYARILHVAQEVEGDDTTALQSVLSCDIERERLMAEEKRISNEMQDETSELVQKDMANRIKNSSETSRDRRRFCRGKSECYIGWFGLYSDNAKAANERFQWRMENENCLSARTIFEARHSFVR